MKPAIEVAGARVFLGDCREVLKSLPDNSVDSVVTDPPYELGFMGKKWDSSGIAYDVTVWQECLRVLKPGGHVLAFGGSRTWHRLAVAVEDAGFELRDSIAWIYGSGFPKSLDVSKAIDKKNGNPLAWQAFSNAYASAVASSDLTHSDIDRALEIKSSSCYWARTDHRGGMPPRHHWEIVRSLLQLPEKFAELYDEAEREVIGERKQRANRNSESIVFNASPSEKEILTAPATAEAKLWQGWGTALKPAFEPVVVGRKPLVGTVAENVLAWGVGGLNIDGSRIGTADELGRPQGTMPQPMDWGKKSGEKFVTTGSPQGRWPANVIFDEVTAGLLDEQSGVTRDGIAVKENSAGRNIFSEIAKPTAPNQGYGGQGGASRFFYVAKASKRDRNEGLEELEATSAGDMVDREEGSAGMNSPRAGAGRTSGAKNFHPTVKPTQLMRYLIKLVTPPGGTVLDPFTGSGSTGKAALLDGFQFVGAELTEEYLPIIEGRLRWASEQVEETDDTLF